MSSSKDLSRRDFLKTAGWVAGAAALAPSLLKGASADKKSAAASGAMRTPGERDWNMSSTKGLDVLCCWADAGDPEQFEKNVIMAKKDGFSAIGIGAITAPTPEQRFIEGDTWEYFSFIGAALFKIFETESGGPALEERDLAEAPYECVPLMGSRAGMDADPLV